MKKQLNIIKEFIRARKGQVVELGLSIALVTTTCIGVAYCNNNVQPETKEKVVVKKEDKKKDIAKGITTKNVNDSVAVAKDILEEQQRQEELQRQQQEREQAKQAELQRQEQQRQEELQRQQQEQARIAEAAKQEELRKQQQEQAKQAAKPTVASYSGGSGDVHSVFASVCAEKGISGAEQSAWAELIRRESGWNIGATNASSGAYGLGQALPGSKMASHGADWQTNPVTQLRWMHDYVKGRYGSFSSAIAFHNANNWY